jgi:hypothetical protein
MPCYASASVSCDLLSVIQGEYREMPGMRLTRAQFQRLWRLSEIECTRAISALMTEGFLGEDGRGRLHCVRESCA